MNFSHKFVLFIMDFNCEAYWLYYAYIIYSSFQISFSDYQYTMTLVVEGLHRLGGRNYEHCRVGP